MDDRTYLLDGIYDHVVVSDGQIISAEGPLPVCELCGRVIRGSLSHDWTCPLDGTVDTRQPEEGEEENGDL